jgi:hypothetical protein
MLIVFVCEITSQTNKRSALIGLTNQQVVANTVCWFIKHPEVAQTGVTQPNEALKITPSSSLKGSSAQQSIRHDERAVSIDAGRAKLGDTDFFYDSALEEQQGRGEITKLVKAYCDEYLQQTVEAPIGENLRWRLLLFKVSGTSVGTYEAS